MHPQTETIITTDGSPTPEWLEFKTERESREGGGTLWRGSLRNAGKIAVRVREIKILGMPYDRGNGAEMYGEGFQMLSQTGGTASEPVALGNHTDAQHYKLPQHKDETTVYNLLLFSSPAPWHDLLAWTSCRRFSGEFRIGTNTTHAILDTENLEIGPGETWELEELLLLSGDNHAAMLDTLATRLNENHPPLFAETFSAPPTGWCSWYCFGPKVTEQNVLDNLDAIAENTPSLRYVQIDDGYQSAMGDWLDTGAAFGGGGVQTLLRRIRDKGFEPAIWVAPFIAEEASRVFREHPDWMVQDENGDPLRSDRVTFGGWRSGPWYALDGTHPGVQAHFEHVFGTMRRDWGCAYFKLDANFWGALHGGHFYDKNATRVEAYRRGMEAIGRGAGADSFLLGCNHPLWPSLGLIHGSRSSGDIRRKWSVFSQTARENLSRNWQNGRLWWNDPDCATLSGDLPLNEYGFHAKALWATGGMILSGDDLTKIPPERRQILEKLLPPTGVAARFDDASLRVGRVDLDDGRVVLCVFRWDESPFPADIPLPFPVCRVRDFWTNEDLGTHDAVFTLPPLAPHSARLLLCEPA